ncbi:AGAP012346-PA-like protein [Anopheles sinensis]|uniref:AGAP012346-PA-like protein n=1 Tax=Anopheles sinensis TaxID=74873 RepID=A0A084VI88_ANOSI|nr:AGAP012346-PA-like protein [Anopheles sinensis]
MANPSKMNPHRQDDYASENYLRRIKAEIRKTNKPIMEKKRRARINNYLNDLKSLLLDAMKKDPVRHSKLEKADILDLTVKHLQDIERRRLAVAMAVDPSVPEKFASGYRECIDEIAKYFDTLGTVDEGLKGRVRKHLESCLTFPGKAGPFPGGVGPFGGVSLTSPDDINNNTQGLLNRVFANNLSLGMFPSAGFLGDLSSAVPFNPFPFFGPLRGVPSGTLPGHGAFPASLDQEVPELKRATTTRDKEPNQPVVPSPPASPGPPNEADDSGTTLMTPVGKTGTLSEQQHTMERLLAIFPTPPSPEDPQPTQRRFGKLGHHFGASPFVPTGRALVTTGGEDETPDTSREEGGPSSDTSREANRDQPDGDDGKDNPNGEMWRPW